MSRWRPKRTCVRMKRKFLLLLPMNSKLQASLLSKVIELNQIFSILYSSSQEQLYVIKKLHYDDSCHNICQKRIISHYQIENNKSYRRQLFIIFLTMI